MGETMIEEKLKVAKKSAGWIPRGTEGMPRRFTHRRLDHCPEGKTRDRRVKKSIPKKNVRGGLESTMQTSPGGQHFGRRWGEKKKK